MQISRSAAEPQRLRVHVDATRETIRGALRGIVRSPGLSVSIVLAFALGIGANATMYETVERLLLRPPPFIENPEGVRRLFVHRQDRGESRLTQTIAFGDYEDFARTSGFSYVVPHTRETVTLGYGEGATQAEAVLVGADYWRMLGVKPLLGRFFTLAEDAVGASPTVVLSWSRWQRDYGGRADALGRTVDFGYGKYTIIGVTPKGFTGIDLESVDLFLPFMVAGAHLNGSDIWVHHRGSYWHKAVARLAPGVSVQSAEAEATALHRAGRAQSTDDRNYDPNATVVAAPLLVAQGPDAPPEAAVAQWLLGVASIVLLIACLNVANLLLARMLRERRETSIRVALGISRRRLIAQIVTEGVLLSLLGGAAALLLATWGGTIVQKTLLPDVQWTGGPTSSLLLLVFAVSVFAGLISAIVPAVQASRPNVSAGLRSTSGGVTRSTARLRATLSTAQAALSVLLLVGAGLFVRSLTGIRATDFGLDMWDVAYVQPMFDQPTTTDEYFAYYDAAAERARHIPGVDAATAANTVPFWSAYSTDLRAQGVESIPGGSTGPPTHNSVDNDYFQTLGIALERGRLFNELDARAAQRVAIVNAAMASALWPSDNAINKCLYIGDDDPPCTEIVGVVENARRTGLLEERDEYQYYVPSQQRQLNRPPTALLVRISGDMEPVLNDLHRELLTDSRVRWVQSIPMEHLVAGELRQWRLGATLFTLFGLLALIVAGIGLYSVLAFDVAQRFREIGLRSALGATAVSIVSLILSRAMRIMGVGIAGGVLLALLLAPSFGEMLYRVDPRDPVTLLIVAGTLIIVAVGAAGLPAWRAAKVDPNVALRAE